MLYNGNPFIPGHDYMYNLDWLVKKCLELESWLKQLQEDFKQVGKNTAAIEALQGEVAKIKAEIERIKNGDYVDNYIEQLAAWIDRNLQELVGRVVKYVFFGLTDDGFFCAYIPETWDFITFDTVIVPEDPNYGHLLLRW